MLFDCHGILFGRVYLIYTLLTKLKDVGRLHTLLLLHALISCVSAYILLLFGTVILRFNGNVFTLVSLICRCILVCKYSLRVCEPTRFAARGHMNARE